MTNIAQHQIFVYGSLRQGFRSPVYEYISRYFSFAGMAKVRGCLVDMGSYPAGVPVEDDHYIIGELYQVKDPAEFSWAIGQLDDYEGVNVEADEEQMYHRELAEVFTDKGTTTAWIYWFSGDSEGKPRLASGDILDYLQQHK